MIKIKRAYDEPAPGDGFKVLKDSLWTRGLKKAAQPYDMWAKNLAPTTQLRRCYHEDPAARWPEFQSKYLAELRQNPALAEFIAAIKKHSTVTLPPLKIPTTIRL